MRKISLISLFLLVGTLALHPQSNYFEYLSSKDGLSDYSINGLYEDEFARMWIATRNGLNCYDGYRFRTWGASEGLNDTYVRRVTGDQAGHLLILTRTQAFVMDLRQEHLTPLQVEKVSTIAGGKAGLWLAASDTLYYMDRLCNLYPMFHASDISAIAPVDSQTVWIASADGVQLLHNGHNSGIHYPTIHQVAQLMLDSRHNLWISTRGDGLYSISPQYHVTHYLSQSNTMSSLTDNDVRCITEDALGNYWIGLYGGLCHLNLQTGYIQRYEYDPRAEHALSTFSVWALTTDRQGTVWIGTFFGGIDLINPQHSIYTYYGAYGKEGHHLSNPIVTNSCSDSQGHIWVGTNGGGVNLLNLTTHQIEYIRIDKNEPQYAVKSMWLDQSRHTLWVGTHRGGIKKIDTHSLAVTDYSLPECNLRKLWADKDILYAMTQRNIYCIDLNTMAYHPLIAPATMPTINGELSDMTKVKDELWFAYSNHLYSYSLTTHQLVSHPFDANVTVLHTDEQQRLLVGTDSHGVWERINNHFAEIETLNAHLPSLYIMSISSCKETFVVTTNMSVHTYDADWVPHTTLSTANGFPLEAMVEHSSAIYTDKILVGGVNGLVLFPIYGSQTSIAPSALQLSHIAIDNEEIKAEEAYPFIHTIQLQPNNHNLTIQATTSGIVTRRNSQIRYRLRNYDHDWITANNVATISYTNLPKGRYTLEIECIDTALHREIFIQVLPHWYDSWWAWLIYLTVGITALIVALIYFGQYIERKMRKQLNEDYQRDLQRATTIVLNHLADDTFNVQQFAREMCVSRTGLYTKLQEIAGQTPNDFILSIRMRESTALLRAEPNMSIVEISERVGFNSSSYFIKCFHRYYGKSPTAWKKD